MTLKKRICIVLAAAILVLTGVALAVENKGAESIELNGGDKGPVPFPHHRHQNALQSCTQCHDAFAQKSGAIDAAKGAGTLKPKQVMNKQCIRCHKAMKKEDKQSGPTSCNTCHVRKG